MGWKRRLLEHDPVLRRTEYYWYNDDENRIGLQTVTDVGAITETNRALYAQTDERAPFGNKRDFHLIGQIPLSIAFDVLKKTSNGKDKKAVARWVNDPDNRAFLTRPVKL